MRQSVGRVRLKFNALLKIDQPQLNFVGGIPKRDVGDQRVKQRAFTRAGFAGKQHVLAGSLANFNGLQFVGATTPHRHAQNLGAGTAPALLKLGLDGLEWNLHLGAGLGLAPNFFQHGLQHVRRGHGLGRKRNIEQSRRVNNKSILTPAHARASL